MDEGDRLSLRLDWSNEALADLTELVEWAPVACRDAVADMERMVRSGFNYGRRLSEPGLWYLPGAVGVYYRTKPGILRVVKVIDAKRLLALP